VSISHLNFHFSHRKGWMATKFTRPQPTWLSCVGCNASGISQSSLKAGRRHQDHKALLSQEAARCFVSLNILLSQSLKITQGHLKWHCWVRRMQVPISIPLKLCMYLVPFLRYSASKNVVTLKPRVGVVQGHWKWRRTMDHIRLSIDRPL